MKRSISCLAFIIVPLFAAKAAVALTSSATPSNGLQRGHCYYTNFTMAPDSSSGVAVNFFEITAKRCDDTRDRIEITDNVSGSYYTVANGKVVYFPLMDAIGAMSHLATFYFNDANGITSTLLAVFSPSFGANGYVATSTTNSGNISNFMASVSGDSFHGGCVDTHSTKDANGNVTGKRQVTTLSSNDSNGKPQITKAYGADYDKNGKLTKMYTSNDGHNWTSVNLKDINEVGDAYKDALNDLNNLKSYGDPLIEGTEDAEDALEKLIAQLYALVSRHCRQRWGNNNQLYTNCLNKYLSESK